MEKLAASSSDEDVAVGGKVDKQNPPVYSSLSNRKLVVEQAAMPCFEIELDQDELLEVYCPSLPLKFT